MLFILAMAIPDALTSLHSRGSADYWLSVIAGIAVMLLTGLVSVVGGVLPLMLATAGFGGLVGGFLYGKHPKRTTIIGYRIGAIGASLAIVVGLVLMASGSWTLTMDPADENVGVTDTIESGAEAYDLGDSGVDESAPDTANLGEPPEGATSVDDAGDGASGNGASGPGSSGVDTPGSGESGANQSENAYSGVDEFGPQTSMFFLATFALIFIPGSALLGGIGSVVGTSLRRIVVPAQYNPPPL
ncbi:hypothetical protein Huta_0137 [Halorhabdus utahensis DSM 12940]|uniref:Uncharacterized protein n=2 Tax=Halorhabdus utahensis TaxID=146826 RepID=C7NP34_HALUD|nr:hypothetical protein Huta_0137 [Halorhabdus utahensis DSM 12940]